MKHRPPRAAHQPRPASPRQVYPLGPGLRRAILEHEATIFAAEGREPRLVRRQPVKSA